MNAFHSNKVVEIQCSQNLKRRVNHRSSSVYGGFHIHINMNSTTRILKAIHTVGGSESMDCTTRTVWICFDRIWLLYFAVYIEFQQKMQNKLLLVLTSNSSSIVHGEWWRLRRAQDHNTLWFKWLMWTEDISELI